VPRQTPNDSPAIADGRRARTAASRGKIVAAFIELVREGALAPTAEQVASRAEVGLRTVFRHFDDMETLYREIATELRAMLTPLFDQPFAADDWQGRLEEIVERRAAVFEAILPFQLALQLHLHNSPFLADNQAQFVQLQGAMLLQALPTALAQQPLLFDALNLLLSFSAWRRLRREQQLGVEAAKQVMRFSALTLAGAGQAK
jgi:AcrR family transcriptional regulator